MADSFPFVVLVCFSELFACTRWGWRTSSPRQKQTIPLRFTCNDTIRSFPRTNMSEEDYEDAFEEDDAGYGSETFEVR